MSSLYLRGKTWWAKSYEQGEMVRWSLRTRSKAEARRKLQESESQRRAQPRESPARGEATWQEAAEDLMTYYRAYGTRDLKQAGYKLGGFESILPRGSAADDRRPCDPGLCGPSEE